MNNLQINFPFKPYNITQHWGNLNASYAAQFNDPTWTRHNGVDANTDSFWPDGTAKLNNTEFPVYMPSDGFKVLQVDFAPQGGGNEIWFISKDKYQMFEKECYVLMVLCHAKTIFLKAGDEPALGELVMIADNTGFSTGLHTHLGIYRVDYNGTWFTKLDTNDATGSFSPEVFFTQKYAVDLATYSTLFKSSLRYYKYKIGL